MKVDFGSMIAPVRFAGREQQDFYQQLVSAMPAESRARLGDIFTMRDRAEHMRKAVEYGAMDRHVQLVNDLISGLVRQKEQTADTGAAEQAKERLADLRVALTRLFKPGQ